MAPSKIRFSPCRNVSADIGILREVEILQTEAPKLSAVQKGRLANLRATADTALELLKQVTP